MSKSYLVLDAMIALLKHKKSTTYVEIASVTGKKKIQILNILNENADLIIQNDGKITGFVDYVKIQRDKAWKHGESFMFVKAQNYEPDKWSINNPKVFDALKESVLIYDNYGFVIPGTSEKCGQLLAMGLVAYNNVKLLDFRDVWAE